MKKRIISSLMVMMMLFAMPMVSAYAAEGSSVGTKTIYLDASAQTDWDSNVSAYYWNSYFGKMQEWPGTQMTKNEVGVYEVEVPANATNVIFTNGKEKTCDLTIDFENPLFKLNTTTTDGKINGTWKNNETTTLYLDATSLNWNSAKVYYWDCFGQMDVAFPGKDMELEKGFNGNLFVCEVPANATHVMFVNGSNQNEKTQDLTINEATPLYKANSSSNGTVNGSWQQSESFTKSGYVVSDNGTSVSNAYVELLDSNGKVLAKTNTNETGLFKFTYHEGAYQIRVSKDGYYSTTDTFTISRDSYGEAKVFEMSQK